MKLGDVLNSERVNALRSEPNAYVNVFNDKNNDKKVNSQAEKVVFSEPYENAGHYYNRHEFDRPQPPEPPVDNQQQNQYHQNSQQPMFDMKSVLPMLMSGKFNDMLKPLMSMFGGGNGGGGGMNFAKIFELFKPKPKVKKEDKKDENVDDASSKFDDFIIIED